MKMMATEDKSRPFPQFAAPPPPMHHHRMPAHEVPHPLPGPRSLYEQPRHQFPTPYDGEPRRASNAPQPPIPSHAIGFSLPQIRPEVSRGPPNSFPAPAHAPAESLPPMHPGFHTVNGAPPKSSPLSAPPSYRGRTPVTPQDQLSITNGESAPPSQSLSQPTPPNHYTTAAPPAPPAPPNHYLTAAPPAPPNHYATAAPPTPLNHSATAAPPAPSPDHYATAAPPAPSHMPGPLDSNCHLSQGYLRQQRKATRAQQVSSLNSRLKTERLTLLSGL